MILASHVNCEDYTQHWEVENSLMLSKPSITKATKAFMCSDYAGNPFNFEEKPFD